jgi:glycosyltransferase involved in cell wall biosynthesis
MHIYNPACTKSFTNVNDYIKNNPGEITAKIAVIIPVYNAADTLEGVFNRISGSVLKEINEFILINDGSTDNSHNVIESLKERFDNLVVITHSRNHGYGVAQKIGFKRALADNMDITVILHADGQYPPEIITDMTDPIRQEDADIVGGSKFLMGNVLKQGMPVTRYIGMVLLNAVENFVFKQKLSIYHSGYRVYSRRALEEIDFDSYSDYFAFDTEMLIGAFINRLKIKEIPIPTYYGKEKSYLNPFRYVSEILWIILKYLFKRYTQESKTKN